MDPVLEKIDRETAADDAKLRAEEAAKLKIFQAAEKPRLDYEAAVKARKDRAHAHATRRAAREAELLANFAPVIGKLRDDIHNEWQKARRIDKRDILVEGDRERVPLLLGLKRECDSAHLDYATPQAADAAIRAKFSVAPDVAEQEQPKKNITEGHHFLVGS